MEDLLPCPFCGSNARFIISEGTSDYDWYKTYYDIGCVKIDCYLHDGADWNCDTKEEVLKMWNKRKNT